MEKQPASGSSSKPTAAAFPDDKLTIEQQGSTVVFHWPVKLTLEAAEQAHAFLQKRLAQKEPFTILSEGLKTKEAPAPVRNAFADFEKKHRDDVKQYYRGMAVVFGSPVTAGLAATINWLAPPPFPKKVFRSVEDAEEWLRSLG
jgi:hypothetical protein